MKEAEELRVIESNLWTDRTVVSLSCWSHIPLAKRMYLYAQMVTDGQYEVHPDDRDEMKKIAPALEAGKCLVFVGQPGAGKTTLTQIIAKVTAPVNTKNRFKFVKAIHIVEEFMKYGLDVLKKYCEGKWVIDDVGVEERASIQGNFSQTYNVFEQLIYEMCEAHAKGRCQFIISTNLSFRNSDEAIAKGEKDNAFLQKYGLRVETRVRQMCEVVKINGTNWRDSKQIVKVFPEVIHPPKDNFEGVPAPEKVREFMDKLASQKKVKEEFKTKQTIETQISGHFEKAWIEQGRMVNDNQERLIEVETGEVITRTEFIKRCKEIFNQTQDEKNGANTIQTD